MKTLLGDVRNQKNMNWFRNVCTVCIVNIFVVTVWNSMRQGCIKRCQSKFVQNSVKCLHVYACIALHITVQYTYTHTYIYIYIPQSALHTSLADKIAGLLDHILHALVPGFVLRLPQIARHDAR